MHRSLSYHLTSSSSSSSSSLAAMAAGPGPSGTAAAAAAAGVSSNMDKDQLPTYNPQSEAGKKEALDASRANLANTLVHLVPVVVLLCGLLLWSLSTTPSSSAVGGIMRSTVYAKLVPSTESISTHNLNRSDMMTGMDGVDPVGKNKVVEKSKGMSSRRQT